MVLCVCEGFTLERRNRAYMETVVTLVTNLGSIHDIPDYHPAPWQCNEALGTVSEGFPVCRHRQTIPWDKIVWYTANTDLSIIHWSLEQLPEVFMVREVMITLLAPGSNGLRERSILQGAQCYITHSHLLTSPWKISMWKNVSKRRIRSAVMLLESSNTGCMDGNNVLN